MNTEPATNSSQSMDGKTIAVISYLTPIGWVIAYILYSNNKSGLAIYHLRQTLLLMICSMGVYAVQHMFLYVLYIGWIMTAVSMVLNIGLFVLWIMGLIAAINNEEKPVPVIGEKAQQLFSKMA